MTNLILKKRHFLGLPGDVCPDGSKGTPKTWVFWGQTVPEKSEENNLPLLCLQLYNFLPLPFDCQACLQNLCSGLKIYSKLQHHSVQFGTKHISRHFCGWLGAETCLIISFPSLQKPGLPKGSSHCIPGITLSLVAFIQCEKTVFI